MEASAEVPSARTTKRCRWCAKTLHEELGEWALRYGVAVLGAFLLLRPLRRSALDDYRQLDAYRRAFLRASEDGIVTATERAWLERLRRRSLISRAEALAVERGAVP